MNCQPRFLAVLVSSLTVALPVQAQPGNLWELGKREAATHRFSTLFTAHDVRDHLASEEGISTAIDWCKENAVTKVYIETFRSGYHAERETLQAARDKFKAAGFMVSGCITTTRVGKPSTGWKDNISCYTDRPTQEKLKAVFEYAAGLFDEIMIDDFWFTDCACPECDAARRAKTVTIGDLKFPVAGDGWDDYRCELMVQLSRACVLAAAKKVNPRAKLIIKYPQWYDDFHLRGYEVIRETEDFDWIWVGTETRDYLDKRWGGTVQYEAYFIMRWLGGIGGAKCGGGWYDYLGTTESTYVEQARQTVMGGAKESMLFHYGGLQKDTGPRNTEALRAHVPELLAVAKEVGRRTPVGLAAYKPANSSPEKEKRIYDFVGMLGLPLVPCHEFPTEAPAAFFSVHALKDHNFEAKLAAFISQGKPVLITDGLQAQLAGKVKLDAPNVFVLAVKGKPKALLESAQPDLDKLRVPLLRPFNVSFQAPNKVALYLFGDGSWVAENFNDEAVSVEFNQAHRRLEARGWSLQWK